MQATSYDEHSDEDDDLRSLLSGNSGDICNPHKKAQQQQQQQQQKQQTQQGQPSQQHQLGQESGHITHLAPLSEEVDNSSMLRSNSNGSNGSQHGNHSSNSKKMLWILGTVILAVGFLGPSGLLWDLLEDFDPDNDGDSQERGHLAMALGLGDPGDHGDMHHHLSPPPPHYSERMETNVHPMIRSTHNIERATSSNNGKKNRFKQHGKFGTAKKERGHKKKIKKKKHAKDGSPDEGWGIKEAINNLDKVFLDKREASADFFQTDDTVEEEALLPVVHYSDGDPNDPASKRLDANVDALDTYTNTQLPASDALECRASVIAFVINATDVRDECDGLRKAFDKTCSVVHHGETGSAVGGGGEAGQHEPRRHEQKRRRLSEWGRPRLDDLIPKAVQMEMERLQLHLRTERRVSKGGHANGSQGKGPTSGRGSHHHLMRGNRTIEERKMQEVMPEEQPVHQQKQEQSPLISLNIPTADKHISEEMLTDTLLLQESSDPKPVRGASVTSLDAQAPPQQQSEQQTHQHQEKTPAEARDQPSQMNDDGRSQVVAEAVANNPKITAASAEAIHDAAESAEVIRTAVDTVKNSMNKDAKSVEARTCCASILSVFHEHCDPTTTGVEDYSDRRLLVVVFVITVCGMVKSLIRHLGIRWLPEAGGCILVGVFGYLILEHLPHVQFAFDGDMFLRIMVPPIVFEAAVKINKQSFRRHVIPICIFAIVGTLASTAFTAFILHKVTARLNYVTTIPVKESLIFGALISSIDPIAVLSVLNNMGISDTDTIYVMIFGESLLNDGVAIVLFQTLVHFLDESLVIDSEVVSDAFMHFVVVALGSVTVGMLVGACATLYFSLMHGCQTPMVEVIMFCCWSFIPYYICDMVEWSGIVAIVANGFIMDLYVIGQKHGVGGENVDDEIDFLVHGSNGRARHSRKPGCRGIFNYEGHLSSKAESHVHFVIEIFATLMETAIFAYLGLFLFSPRYHWSGYLTMISVFATVMGRVIMVPLFSQIANTFNRMSQASMSRNIRGSASTPSTMSTNSEGVHIDKRMQLILVFAGLRGAMSFALVEHIPMFDTTTGQGSRLKPELKAMTSASVIFTVFVLGGATSYLMERLGYLINKEQHQDSFEIVPLVRQQDKRKSPAAKKRVNEMFSSARDSSSLRSNSSVRQRGPR